MFVNKITHSLINSHSLAYHFVWTQDDPDQTKGQSCAIIPVRPAILLRLMLDLDSLTNWWLKVK